MKGEFNPNLTIVTQFLPNHQELADITSVSKREYAARWGYGFHEVIGNYSELGFDFQRIEIVRDLLKKDGGPDVIWWTGADCIILNHTKPVTDVLGVLPWKKSFLIAADVNYINDDSFLIRKTDWSFRWLDFILSKEPEYRADPWMAQRIIQHYAETPEWSSGVQLVPPNCLNSYDYGLYDWSPLTPGHFRKGDLLLHGPGLDLRQRLELFRSQRVQDAIIR